jgi:hypothetical protein
MSKQPSWHNPGPYLGGGWRNFFSPLIVATGAIMNTTYIPSEEDIYRNFGDELGIEAL